MIHWFRLVRPINLIIIAATMYGLGWFFDGFIPYAEEFGVITSNFFFLVLSTVLIAAAGNIINDVYDVFPDAINKPDKLIIGKHIGMKKALLLYLFLNLMAVFLAMILSSELGSLGFILIHSACISILWVYSRYLKRMFLIGNIVIALLTGFVLILVGFYYVSANPTQYDQLLGECLICSLADETAIYVSTILAIFAFMLNLGREIIKDIEDVPGDTYAKAKTLPITLGIKTSEIIIVTVLTGTLVLIFTAMYALSGNFSLISILLITPAVFIVITIFTIFRSKTHKHYKQANYWLKLAMVAGLAIPIVWRLLYYYG